MKLSLQLTQLFTEIGKIHVFKILVYVEFLFRGKLAIETRKVEAALAGKGSAQDSDMLQDDVLALSRRTFSAWCNLFWRKSST